jgi:hypothetical protein
MAAPYPPEVKELALSMIREGFTYATIAAQLGINKSTVVTWACERHEAPRPKPKPYVETDPHTGSVVRR